MTKLEERLYGPGPKRVLALDGGGIRGALTLGFLERIEEILKERSPDPDKFRLRDYFDLIAGTSTGSIIASALACGYMVKDIQDQYIDMGGKIFGKRNRSILWGKARFITLKAQYSHQPLEDALEAFFGDTLIGDQEKITTGLCIVAKRADTFSTWPMHNFPRGKYYDFNGHYRIRDLVRASSAAPTFFEPKKILVNPSKNKYGLFIDGGVSLANNPAFQALLLANLKGFSLNWAITPGNLSITSVGTGGTPNSMDMEEVEHMKMIGWAEKIPDLFMQDANYFNQALLQWLSDSPTAKEIDSEIGDLKEDELAGKPIHYTRYNVELFSDRLREVCGKSFGNEQEMKLLRQMDRAENRHKLLEIGQLASQHEEVGVKPDHFPAAFDPPLG